MCEDRQGACARVIFADIEVEDGDYNGFAVEYEDGKRYFITDSVGVCATPDDDATLETYFVKNSHISCTGENRTTFVSVDGNAELVEFIPPGGTTPLKCVKIYGDCTIGLYKSDK